MVQISVIIPVYNAAKFIGRTIEKVQSQTFHDWELILINDGSNDNSAEIMEQYAAKDVRIRLFHRQNGGPAAARNCAMELATGKYLLCLDADDDFSKDMFATMHTEAERLQADIVMCGMEVISSSGEHIALHHGIPSGHILNRDEITKYALGLYFSPQPCGISSLWDKLFLTKWIRRNNLKLREDLIRAEDWIFILECFQIEPMVHFAAVDNILYSYYTNESGVMHTYREGEFRQAFELTPYLHEVGRQYGINMPYEFYRATLYNGIHFIISINRSNAAQKKEYLYEIINHHDFRKALAYLTKVSLPKRYMIIAWLLRFRLKIFALKFC